ncbi:MAG: hypothetical protein ACI9WS_003475 [Paraglaciecola psychrophila]|jgi:hypothetical protein
MQSSFLSTALTGQVVQPALRIALLVGSVLVLINHGSALLAGQLDSARLLQIALTYCVPYCVSTYSAVRAIRGMQQAAAQ